MSVYLVGNSKLSDKLRVLVCLELYLNSEYYANHPYLHETYLANTHLFSDFKSILSIALSSEIELNLDNVNLIKKEALAMCVDNVFSSFICVLALSSVIKRPINVHYPDFGLLVNRLVFDCEIFPRANDSFCLNSFGDPINILRGLPE